MRRLNPRLQRFLPTHLISFCYFLASRSRFRPWKRWLINWFISAYDVDTREALYPDVDDYPHFNAFFTRALAPGCRHVDPNTAVISCPVDGTISQYGQITDNRMVQAKSRYFTVDALLGPAVSGADFLGGEFITFYLSPRNYHRVHMPCTGHLISMSYIPGRMFKVDRDATNEIPGLYARNERLICMFDSAFGRFCLVMVGALIVSGLETVWHGPIRTYRPGPVTWSYLNANIYLQKGVELGRFNVGSTVILLFGNDSLQWSSSLNVEMPVVYGQTIAAFIAT